MWNRKNNNGRNALLFADSLALQPARDLNHVLQEVICHLNTRPIASGIVLS